MTLSGVAARTKQKGTEVFNDSLYLINIDIFACFI